MLDGRVRRLAELAGKVVCVFAKSAVSYFGKLASPVSDRHFSITLSNKARLKPMIHKNIYVISVA